jgi:hypothetical protein
MGFNLRMATYPMQQFLPSKDIRTYAQECRIPPGLSLAPDVLTLVCIWAKSAEA